MDNKAQQSLEATENPTQIQMKNYIESLHFPISSLNHDVSLEKVLVRRISSPDRRGLQDNKLCTSKQVVLAVSNWLLQISVCLY